MCAGKSQSVSTFVVTSYCLKKWRNFPFFNTARSGTQLKTAWQSHQFSFVNKQLECSSILRNVNLERTYMQF